MVTKNLMILFLLLLLIPCLSFCGEYYVDAVIGSNNNSGTSPNNAWKTITYALNHVSGTSGDPVEINISSGVYITSIGETFPLEMKSYVSLIGEDKYSTILDATGANKRVIELYLDEEVTIDNLTITGGKPTDNWNYGGGIECDDSSPIIKNCIFKNNEASLGGGDVLY